MMISSQIREADLRAKITLGLVLEQVSRAGQKELERARVFLEGAARDARSKTPSTTIPAVEKSVPA